MRCLNGLYLLLLFMAVAAVFAWSVTSGETQGTEWISVWAPHVAVAAFELLLAAAVLDRWTRRQEAALRRPLSLAAERGMRALLCDLSTMLVIQRAYLASLPGGTPKVADAFDLEDWEAAVREADYVWLGKWEQEIERICGSLTLAIGRYEEVLAPPCAAAAWRLLSEWEVGAGARIRARNANVRLVRQHLTDDAERGNVAHDVQADVLSIITRCRGLCLEFDDVVDEGVELRAGLDGTLRLIDVIRRLPPPAGQLETAEASVADGQERGWSARLSRLAGSLSSLASSVRH